MVFVDLEKAYDLVPRELIWWSLRKKRVPEAYIKIIQDIVESNYELMTREPQKNCKKAFYDIFLL